MSKFHTPRRKGVEHKSCCLYKHFRHSDQLLFLKVERSFLESKFPDASQRLILQGGLSKARSQTLYVKSFLHICLPCGRAGLHSQIPSGGQTQNSLRYMAHQRCPAGSQEYGIQWRCAGWRQQCGSCRPIVTLKAVRFTKFT